MSHALQGQPRWTGHSREFWQNVVHWSRKWQATPIVLLQEPHEQYETAKRYDAEDEPPGVKSCSVRYWGRVEGNH